MDLAQNIQNHFDKEEDEFILGKFTVVRKEYSDLHYVYFEHKTYVGEFDLVKLITKNKKDNDQWDLFRDYFKNRKITKNHHILCVWNTHKSKFSKISNETEMGSGDSNDLDDKSLVGFVLLWEDEKNGHVIPLSVSIRLKSVAPTREVLLEFSHTGNPMWYKYGPRRYNNFSKNKYDGRLQN